MSIASELTALNGYILGAYDEINDKGGTVPANKNMANLASAISSISTGTPTTITSLEVTENGTYTAPTGTAYSPVTVNVSGGGGIDLSSLKITEVSSKIATPYSTSAFYSDDCPKLSKPPRLLIVTPLDDATVGVYNLRNLTFVSYGADDGYSSLTDDTFMYMTCTFGTTTSSASWFKYGTNASSTYVYPTSQAWKQRCFMYTPGTGTTRPAQIATTATGSTYVTYKTDVRYLIVAGC